MTPSLFAKATPTPLPDRLRPTKLSEVIGQDHLLKPDGPIGRMVARKRLSSMILWGPPGTGKTTIARLLARDTGFEFEQLPAVLSGFADLRKTIEVAKQRRLGGRSTVLFLDECHRWTSSQQDALLPHVGDGTMILIGATTENPSFSLNAALLSRCTVFTLKRFDGDALERLAGRAETKIGKPLPLTAEARAALIEMADGDGRYLLNLCDQLFQLDPTEPLDVAALADAVQRRAPVYDKSADGHSCLRLIFCPV